MSGFAVEIVDLRLRIPSDNRAKYEDLLQHSGDITPTLLSSVKACFTGESHTSTMLASVADSRIACCRNN